MIKNLTRCFIRILAMIFTILKLSSHLSEEIPSFLLFNMRFEVDQSFSFKLDIMKNLDLFKLKSVHAFSKVIFFYYITLHVDIKQIILV
jgi:hypothetical protein